MVLKFQIPSTASSARQVEERLLREVADRGYTEGAAFAIRLALEEGLNNAIRHGNRYDPGRKVTVEFDIDDERVEIDIFDQGNGFDLGAVPDPTADENLEKPSGRGIMLMRAFMDEVRYSPKGSRVHMVKRNT